MPSLEAAVGSMHIAPPVQNSNHHELLPPEIWVDIIDHCNKASQRTCLSLSRAFHSRTIPLLFREVTLCFGAWEAWVAAGADEHLDEADDTQRHDALDETRSSRAFDILRRITVDAFFARVVRSVEIEAYMVDGSRGVFEKCCLVEALHALPNLESFFWNGCSPTPSPGVLDALATSCPGLQDLALPILSFVALPFHKLKGLRWIAFNWTVEDIIDPLLDAYQDVKINEETFPNLRELHLFFTTPDSVRLLGGLLDQLTHLNLLFIRDLDRLEVLLQSLPHVQSLTLQTLRENQEAELLRALTHAPFRLPRLTQLKICGEEPADALPSANVALLAEVVRGVPSLQCFDCSFAVAAAHLGLLSPAILSLKHLRVLGLHVGLVSPAPGPGAVRDVLRQLPPQLDALALVISGASLNEYELAELWTHCQRLEYLYLGAGSDVAVSAQDLARAGKSLQLVGLKNAFHYVERDGEDARLSDRWSDRKVEFRGTADFGCSDWEWLMREKIIW